MSATVDVRVSQYTVSLLPPTHPAYDRYVLQVDDMGDGQWAVYHPASGLTLSADLGWDVEHRRVTPQWLAQHRFSEQQALEAAKQVAGRVIMDGYTADQIAAGAWRREQGGPARENEQASTPTPDTPGATS